MSEVIDIFQKLGGSFLSSPDEIRAKARKIKAFVFDWDGVFNEGIKFGDSGSPFSETDSMGTNMLRFAHFLAHETLPPVYILTGANNPTAVAFAQREHFHGVIKKAAFKRKGLEIICEKNGLQPENCLFLFDDILDLEVARMSGLSMMIKNTSSPLLEKMVIEKGDADYISGHSGGQQAVREVCELLLGLADTYENTIEKRIQFEGDYARYLDTRKAIVPEVIDMSAV